MRIIEAQLNEGKIYGMLPVYQQREKNALHDIGHMLKVFPNSYLSLSWGKQSIILAHMIYQLKCDIPVVFFNEPDTDIIADFTSVRDQFLTKWPVNYVEINDGKMSPRRSAKDYVAKNNMNGVIMGLAAHESKSRAYAMKRNNKYNIYNYADGMGRCCPLAYWTIKDYGAYISKYQIPLLSIYIRYGLESRTSAGITPGRPSYTGREFLSSSAQTELDRRWRKRNEL